MELELTPVNRVVDLALNQSQTLKNQYLDPYNYYPSVADSFGKCIGDKSAILL